jgi:hypothetical protein
MRVNSELEKMWKEPIIARFKILSFNISGGTEEDHKEYG